MVRGGPSKAGPRGKIRPHWQRGWRADPRREGDISASLSHIPTATIEGVRKTTPLFGMTVSRPHGTPFSLPFHRRRGREFPVPWEDCGGSGFSIGRAGRRTQSLRFQLKRARFEEKPGRIIGNRFRGKPFVSLVLDGWSQAQIGIVCRTY